MAFGIGEDPALSVTSHLEAVDYPVWRENLVKAAADGGASVDVINVLKCLPRGRYESPTEVLRDLAEASRRFGMGNMKGSAPEAHDRRNLGRDAVENAVPPLTRHP